MIISELEKKKTEKKKTNCLKSMGEPDEMRNDKAFGDTSNSATRYHYNRGDGLNVVVGRDE